MDVPPEPAPGSNRRSVCCRSNWLLSPVVIQMSTACDADAIKQQIVDATKVISWKRPFISLVRGSFVTGRGGYVAADGCKRLPRKLTAKRCHPAPARPGSTDRRLLQPRDARMRRN